MLSSSQAARAAATARNPQAGERHDQGGCATSPATLEEGRRKTMEISTDELLKHLTRIYLNGCVHRVVFQEDLSAYGSDAADLLLVSLPPLLKAPVLPCPVAIDSPCVLGSLIELLPDQGPTTELSYDDTIQSLVFEFGNGAPVACPVWPQNDKEMAADAAWIDRVLGSYDYSRAVSLYRDATDIMQTIGQRFPGEVLQLQVDSTGAFLVPHATGSARLLVPMSTETELDAEVWADLLVAALDHLPATPAPRLVPSDLDGRICLTDDSALYVLS